MLLKVQEISLPSNCIFDAMMYPNDGFYKVTWAGERDEIISLMHVRRSTLQKLDTAGVQYISDWDGAEPFLFWGSRFLSKVISKTKKLFSYVY